MTKPITISVVTTRTLSTEEEAAELKRRFDLKHPDGSTQPQHRYFLKKGTMLRVKDSPSSRNTDLAGRVVIIMKDSIPDSDGDYNVYHLYNDISDVELQERYVRRTSLEPYNPQVGGSAPRARSRPLQLGESEPKAPVRPSSRRKRGAT